VLVDGNERKARTGVDHTFLWDARSPQGLTPTLTVYHPTAGTLTPAMSKAVDNFTITAVASDRRTLTVDDPLIAIKDGYAGNWGRAWVVTTGDGAFPVTISSWDGTTTVVLADSLPQNITAAGAWLEWARYEATLGSGDATATTARNIRWTVTSTPLWGSNASEASDEDSGVLHVVPVPFDTGLSHSKFVAVYPALAERVPRRQTSLDPQIAAAKRELVLQLRRDLSPTRHEDQVLGAHLFDAHAALAAANIEQDAEASDRHMAKFDRLYALALASNPWLDDDIDGTVDSGETGVTIKGPRAQDHQGNASRYTGRNPQTSPYVRFSIGGDRG